MSVSRKSIAAEFDAQVQQLTVRSKIMMIDDEPINMRVLQLHLEAEGYERIVTLSDSTQAMSMLRSEQPSVLLLDLHMPEVSGIEILSQIRADEQLKRLPVIVLTSSKNLETKVEALQLGATDFLSKPVDPTELALRMRNTIAARAHQQRVMHFDSLTNLPNRLYFTELIDRLMISTVDDQTQLALVLINIDSLKSIRESFGPDRSEDVIWAFSQRLQAVFESTDNPSPSRMLVSDTTHCVARLAGDRFGALIPVTRNFEDDEALLGRVTALLDVLESPFVVDRQDVYLSVSVGISELNMATESFEGLVDEAETAMLYAQRSRDHRYAFYSQKMVAMTSRKLRIENGLRTAIENNEMYLAYQPKVSLHSGLIVGAEALLRWEHPELGAMSPGEFIPIAESTGLIVTIGQWVLEQAVHQSVLFRQMGHPDFQIAVNVSIRQLHEAGFHGKLCAALGESGLPPNALIVELTENMLMENADDCLNKLLKIKRVGVELSIDDFGTGYSSLSYLQRFPIDQLKIDLSFIKEIKTAQDKAPIVNAIISLAHDLEMSVVAEGVETRVQLDRLKSLNCEQYQGYYKSKPVSAQEFAQLLNMDTQKIA